MQTQDQYITIPPSDLRWMDFIAECPTANIFHHPAWIKLMADCYGFPCTILVILGDNGQIRAGLPFMKINSFLTGRRWVSFPFSDYCLPLYRETSDLEDLTDALMSISSEKRNGKVEVRWK